MPLGLVHALGLVKRAAAMVGVWLGVGGCACSLVLLGGNPRGIRLLGWVERAGILGLLPSQANMRAGQLDASVGQAIVKAATEVSKALASACLCCVPACLPAYETGGWMLQMRCLRCRCAAVQPVAANCTAGVGGSAGRPLPSGGVADRQRHANQHERKRGHCQEVRA